MEESVNKFWRSKELRRKWKWSFGKTLILCWYSCLWLLGRKRSNDINLERKIVCYGFQSLKVVLIYFISSSSLVKSSHKLLKFIIINNFHPTNIITCLEENCSGNLKKKKIKHSFLYHSMNRYNNIMSYNVLLQYKNNKLVELMNYGIHFFLKEISIQNVNVFFFAISRKMYI